MNRRQFFGIVAGGAVAAKVKPAAALTLPSDVPALSAVTVINHNLQDAAVTYPIYNLHCPDELADAFVRAIRTNQRGIRSLLQDAL